MENIKYISEGHLKGIAKICEHNLNPELKKTLKRLQEKYKITFTTDKRTNANLMWKAYSDELMTANWRSMVTNKTYAEAYRQTNSINIECSDMLKVYIEHNYKEDYSFIFEFDPERYIINEINHIMRLAGGSNANGQTFYYYAENLTELLNCTDYYKFFSEKFGIQNVDKKAMKATKQALKNFDELLADIPNKAIFFQSLATYYQNNDLSELHNTLHTN